MNARLRVGIDGSNLRGGGGVTHLVELLRHADPHASGIEQVTAWGARALLDRLPDREWLVRAHEPALEGSLASRLRWRKSRLRELARASADVLFVPGSSDGAGFRPYATMCRNMLPFQWRERARYGLSKMWLRLSLLHFTQAAAFRRADGVIFLNDFARAHVGAGKARVAVIPHGVSERFRRAPREQLPLSVYSSERPLRLLYTSIVDVYKHQWNVAHAVLELREEGLPLALDLAGPAYPPAMRRLQRVLADDRHGVVRWLGNIDHAALPASYHEADAFVFASTCENMPNILVEAMAAGLPMACSSHAPMPAFLGDGGVYFDPTRKDDVKRAIRELVADPERRARLAAIAYERALAWTWQRCAADTFAFLRSLCVE